MHRMVEHALMKGSPKSAKPKHLKEFHAKELHDGKYHVQRHSGHPSEKPVEHTAENMNEVHQAMEEHMGQPNDGEEASESPQFEAGEQEGMGKGQPGMGGV